MSGWYRWSHGAKKPVRRIENGSEVVGSVEHLEATVKQPDKKQLSTVVSMQVLHWPSSQSVFCFGS